MTDELQNLSDRIQSVQKRKGIEGLSYEDLCIHHDDHDVELPGGYKPPKFEMFDDIGDLKAHLRT